MKFLSEPKGGRDNESKDDSKNGEPWLRVHALRQGRHAALGHSRRQGNAFLESVEDLERGRGSGGLAVREGCHSTLQLTDVERRRGLAFSSAQFLLI